MPTLRESLSVPQQLACAVRQHTPIQLAQTFAAYEGQFYDRLPFDERARQVHALYAPNDADLFRSRSIAGCAIGTRRPWPGTRHEYTSTPAPRGRAGPHAPRERPPAGAPRQAV